MTEAKTNNGEKKVKPKKTKLQKKRSRRKIYNFLMGAVIFGALLGVVSGVSTIALILNKSDVEINLSGLASSEVSLIYDSQGNEIYRLGYEDRINVSYNDLPQHLIDAFVAVEDSRFFEHPGFDMPRFAKAILENIASMSFAQGGSTITMQVIKNSYFAVDTIAASDGHDGIPRKVQEIYYALRINNLISKGKVLELYINKINYGSSARGVQVAADYYFSKDVRELNLVECAMLAGIINGPNENNPYYHPTNCQNRTATVLDMMHYHGYITDEEYDLALKVQVVDLLSGNKEAVYQDGMTIPNQAYVDTVINELEQEYGIDPYTEPVRVYTGMNQALQKYLDDVSDNKVFAFKDSHINYACAVVQNYTGLIVGINGGRSYDTVRGFNYAVDGRMPPASSIKAVLPYPMGFEYGGVATSSCIAIEPITYAGTGITIHEDSGGYAGQKSVACCLSSSYNIGAIKLIRKAQAAVGNEVIQNYLRAMNFDDEVVDSFAEQHAIGGGGMVCSPLQLAGAGSMILSRGKYTKPHTITRIEFINSTKEPIVANYQSQQLISEDAAWLTSEIMRYNVNPGASTLKDVTGNGRVSYCYDGHESRYGKTGTGSLPEYAISQYHMPKSGTKDRWLLMGNNDYTIASWTGYDYGKYIDSTTYHSVADRSYPQDSYIMKGIFSVLVSQFGYAKHENPRPAGVVKITHVFGPEEFYTYPDYETEFADPEHLKVTGFVKTEFAKVSEYPTPTIDSLSTMNATAKGNTINITFSAYPDKTRMVQEATTYSNNKYKWNYITGLVQYYVHIYTDDGTIDETFNPTTNSAEWTLPGGTPEKDVKVNVEVYYAYAKAPVQSNSIIRTVTIKGVPKPVEPDPNNNPDNGNA